MMFCTLLKRRRRKFGVMALMASIITGKGSQMFPKHQSGCSVPTTAVRPVVVASIDPGVNSDYPHSHQLEKQHISGR